MLIAASCELLSFIVSLLFENSLWKEYETIMSVVNCFHLSYLCSLKTAASGGCRQPRGLWIAFIYRIFALWKQHGWWWEHRPHRLWIAFIYRIFALWKQHFATYIGDRKRCELLSFIVSLLFENSWATTGSTPSVVVNCFHLSYLCSLKTARRPPLLRTRQLWIAFIYRIFALWKQQQEIMIYNWIVVNCFHLSYLCSLKTALHTTHTTLLMLWIAFIYRIFALWKQLQNSI